MDLSAELDGLAFGPAASAWDGFEVNVGYAVMNLPMATGDQLALRVFPRTDFGGYVSVWHRDPGGAWSQFVDLAPVEAGCPRAWGPALEHAGPASIHVDWTGPNELDVRMDRPQLQWQLSMSRTLPLALLNLLHAPLPLSTWRPRALVAAREWVARLLGLGAVSMAGVVPTGERLVAVLRRMFWVEHATARLDGRDLGGPVVLDECPTIGGWPLPRRGVFAIGEAHATIGDRGQYQQLREEALGSAGA